MLVVLQPLAMLVGCAAGWFSPTLSTTASGASDYLILALVTCLFSALPGRNHNLSRPRPRIMVIAWIGNFLIIPLIAALLTLLAWRADADIRLGLAIYMLSPCTDWFLGFTRLAHGDTATGAALIPLNMLSQLLLYPLWLMIFGGLKMSTIFSEILPTLGQWFFLPAALGLIIRTLPQARRLADHLIPWILAALVATIFCTNADTILTHPTLFVLVLGLVFTFFVTTYQLGKHLFRRLGVDYPAEALLTMTTSARNSPLMVSLSTLVLPDRPLVLATLVLGMLVEFPHLTVVTRLVLGRRPGVGQKVPLPELESR
ncbi:symporter [Corynebacterium sp. 3HC-13]|uniref:arsenic resistance protein n=1 Tax=Corynebacterium poyangense TaxID=2684405 RepID=UPI001CCF6EC5|nr:symporter [Corynebacterium poyangense]MBZ8176451.1 symporter [Corynebacterium poyangense]